MTRHFPDWLSAYLEYAQDAYCPPQFHFWTGVSILSGALERKVWINRTRFRLFPNLYVLLIAKPGIGKSSAGNECEVFLRELKMNDRAINFIANQNSEASFIQQCAAHKEFFVGDQKHTHSSSFFYASEASNSLKEMVGGGTVTACLTEFYDCPTKFVKKLKSEECIINNVCMSLLACCTFSHLKRLIPKEEAEGGFASRLLYVVQDEVVVRTPKWAQTAKSDETKRKLAEDLLTIHHLSGAFEPSPEFIEAYEEWFPEHDRKTQLLRSERMQYFMARKHTNATKLAMLCSVSESNSMRIELRHWERALKLIEELELKLPRVLDHSMDKEKQGGINYIILRAIQALGGTVKRRALYAYLVAQGIDVGRIEMTMTALLMAGAITSLTSSPGDLASFEYRLNADPNDYL